MLTELFILLMEYERFKKNILMLQAFFPESWNSFKINFVLLYVCLIRDYIQYVAQEIP